MTNPPEQVISCFNESGSLVTIIKARRQPDPDIVDEAPLTVIYYTTDGYLVELLPDGNFKTALTREKLTRAK